MILLVIMSLIVMPTFAQDPPPDDCTSERVLLPAPLDGMTGEILVPTDCSDVPMGTPVDTSGNVQLPTGYEAWILVYAPNGRYYPQRIGDSCVAMSMDPDADGTWNVASYLGEEDDTPDQFDVVLVAVSTDAGDADLSAHQILTNYWENGCNIDLFEGFAPEDLPMPIYELFEIIVNGITPPPPCSFVVGEDVEVAEDSGDFVDAPWATDIMGENFVVTTDNDALFSVSPAIALGDGEAEDGTLTFTPADEMFGVATVTVELFDADGVSCQVEEFTITVLPVNDPPECDAAFADPDFLWPPNHRMVEIAIGGITDPDSTVFTFVIDSIESDEPENGLGDGNTAPDYEVTDSVLDTGEDTQTASVRSERSGLGVGRTYTITFTVDDADFTGDLGDDFTEEDVIDGGTCSNTVVIFVPHDMGNNATAATDDEPGAISDSIGVIPSVTTDTDTTDDSASSTSEFPPAVSSSLK